MTSTVYTPEAIPAFPEKWSLTGAMPDELVGLTPLQLEDERGGYQMQMIDTLDNTTLPEHTRANTIALLQGRLDHIDRQINRYRNHPTIKIRWPDRSRANDLVRLAHDLKEVIPLEQFINEVVMTTRLERSGDRWKGICPIPTHEEQTPSFVVYPDDGGWYCFGACGRGGDIYALAGLVFGLELFRDQVRLVADFYGRQVAS